MVITSACHAEGPSSILGNSVKDVYCMFLQNIIGVFLDDKRSGRCFAAPDFHGMTLPQAVAFAQKATSL